MAGEMKVESAEELRFRSGATAVEPLYRIADQKYAVYWKTTQSRLERWSGAPKLSAAVECTAAVVEAAGVVRGVVGEVVGGTVVGGDIAAGEAAAVVAAVLDVGGRGVAGVGEAVGEVAAFVAMLGAVGVAVVVVDDLFARASAAEASAVVSSAIAGVVSKPCIRLSMPSKAMAPAATPAAVVAAERRKLEPPPKGDGEP